jgi:hypothetical protein
MMVLETIHCRDPIVFPRSFFCFTSSEIQRGK